MKVDTVNSAAMEASASPVQAAVGKTLSEDDFLKIFLKQMTMQSPDKPLDSGEMMQQMSQLTSLESNKSMKKAIENMNKSIGQSQLLSATQLVGRQVVVESDKSTLTAQEGLKGAVAVEPGVSNVSVNIMDERDRVVRTIQIPGNQSGIIDFSWDGRNEAGESMNPGMYKMVAKGTFNNADRNVPTAGYFRVNSVTMDRQSSSVAMNVNGLEGAVGLSDIIKFLG